MRKSKHLESTQHCKPSCLLETYYVYMMKLQDI